METKTVSISNGSRDFIADTSWSLISLAFQVAAGAALNLGLFFYFGPEPLGVFNQAYAAFVISGQLFVFGLNDSALKYSAEHLRNKAEQACLASSVLFWACVAGVIGAVSMVVFATSMGPHFFSDTVQLGLLLMAPGLFLFVFNKVLVGILIGRHQFFRLAILQALRAVILVVLVFAVVVLALPLGLIGACFTATEIIVVLAQADIVRQIFRDRSPVSEFQGEFARWSRTHLVFGGLSMPHGVLSESFIRIDILVLAFFLDDASIGIYSFAAFIIEGVYQVPVLIRNITNPRLVRIFSNRDFPGLLRQVAQSGGSSLLLTVSTAAAIMWVLPIVNARLNITAFNAIYEIIGYAFIGLVFYSFFIPFDFGFLQGGSPALQSVFMFSVTSINVVANIVLIPDYGLMGAAIGTAGAMVASGIILTILLTVTFRIWAWPFLPVESL